MAEQQFQGSSSLAPVSLVRKPSIQKVLDLVLGFGKFAQYDMGILLPPFRDPRWQFFLYQTNKKLRDRHPEMMDLDFHERYDEDEKRLVTTLYGSEIVNAELKKFVTLHPSGLRLLFPMKGYFGFAAGRRPFAMELFEVGKQIPHFYVLESEYFN